MFFIKCIFYFIFCFWFALETIFKAFLQTFFSLDCFKLSDQAISFAGETIKVIVSNSIVGAVFIVEVVVRRKFSWLGKYNLYWWKKRSYVGDDLTEVPFPEVLNLK